MIKLLRFLTLALVFGLVFSCQQEGVDPNGISEDTLAKIAALGLSTDKVTFDAESGGYLVEGDILLMEEDLHQIPEDFRIPNLEQYRTFNLVTALPRTITCYMEVAKRGLPSSYLAALDEAIARYNAENLSITFQRVSSPNADISFVRGNGSYLASAGFPTAGGDPHNEIKVNSRYLGRNPNTDYLATILSHEMGHCIGFRHTDWMDRSYSCGGATSNEGQETSGVGAVRIGNTPAGPDPGSFMLACIGSNQNRPFNANDVDALNFLY